MKAREYLRKIQYKNQQRTINKQYQKEGLTNDILRKQVQLNQLRNKYNIPDESKLVYDNFVQ